MVSCDEIDWEQDVQLVSPSLKCSGVSLPTLARVLFRDEDTIHAIKTSRRRMIYANYDKYDEQARRDEIAANTDWFSTSTGTLAMVNR